MGLFPSYIKLENIEKEEMDLPREYGIDFQTGNLTGKIVEGLEAIKVWVWHTLKISRYRYFIYSWDYGDEIEDLIGKGYSSEYIETEAKRMVTESLLINKYIQTISNFSVIQTNDKLNLFFTINAIYGSASMCIQKQKGDG